MARRHPRVHPIVSEGSTTTIVPGVLSGQLNAAIIHLPIDDPAAQGLNWGGQVGFYLADVAYMATGVAGLLFAALGMAWGLVLVARKVRLVADVDDLPNLASFMEAGLGSVVFIGAAVFFLVSLESFQNLAYLCDPGPLQAVKGADRKIQIFDIRLRYPLRNPALFDLGLDLQGHIADVGDGSHVLDHELSSRTQCLCRRDGTVRPDLHDQTVEIADLSDPGSLDLVVHPAHRAKDGIGGYFRNR